MNVKIGERYSNEIEIKNYGMYTVNNPKEPVYIVQWAQELQKADINGHKDVDGHTYTWNVGDYLCRAIWLEKLEDGRNWYTMDCTRQKCIINLDKAVREKNLTCAHSLTRKETIHYLLT